MKYLLDTVTFLRAYFGETEALSSVAARILEEKENILYLSSASAWEIALKHSVGRLHLKVSPAVMLLEGVSKMDVTPLPITLEHAAAVAPLPWHHRDPFDRLLIAQAQMELLPILTPDEEFKKYSVRVVW